MNFLVALSLLIFTLLSCSTTPTGRSQLKLMSDGKMNHLGAETFNEMKRKQAIENDFKINKYVKCVAYSLIRKVDDNTGVNAWEVVVFKDESANAFALPGGKIGVHTGLLKVAKTQHQLAAVLGHEVGHVIARHGQERMSQGIVSQVAMIGLGVATQGNENQQAIMVAAGLGAQFGVLLPFSRAHESEGDIIGLELMSKAGFDPRGSVQLWQNMAEAGGAAPPEFMSTHPSHGTRIKNLNSQMSKNLKIYNKVRAAGKSPDCDS